MINFGYSISKQRVIDLDKNSSTFADEVAGLEPSFNICINCGTCAATCSANNFTEFGLRKIMLSVKRGEIENVSDEIQKCMLCGKCMLICPAGVNTRNVLISINKVCRKNERK